VDPAGPTPPASSPGAAALASPTALRTFSDPAAAQDRTPAVRFDLAVPSKTAPKTDFTVNLLAAGPGFEKAELDLVLDQSGIRFIKIEPRAGVTLDAKQEGNSLHISIGKVPAADGSLAMLTFQADQAPGGPLNLSLQNLKVEKENHAQMAAAVALPKQIAVSP
jgi:general secretion pathway protein D